MTYTLRSFIPGSAEEYREGRGESHFQLNLILTFSSFLVNYTINLTVLTYSENVPEK